MNVKAEALAMVELEMSALRQFLPIYLPVVSLILLGAWLVGQARIDAELSLLKANVKLVTGVNAGRLKSQLQIPVDHLQSIAAEAPVRSAINDGGAEARNAMAAAFTTLLSRNQEYDEVRWIDQTGMERVRLNHVLGYPTRATESALQNKSHRYYFQQTMQLGKGAIYLSPLDLNVEKGRVEVPYKPMLRVAMPVFNDQQQARGILIINVGAKSLLQSLTSEEQLAPPQLMLLNQAGFWLKSQNKSDEWGFMFNRTETLATRFPQAWTQIVNAEQGQVKLSDGLWTWQKVNLFEPNSNVTVKQASFLLVVSHLPAANVASIYRVGWLQVGSFATLLLLLSGWLVVRLIQIQNRHISANVAALSAQSEAGALRKQLDAEQRFRQVVEANINGILVVDIDGRIVMVNPALTQMFGYDRDELNGQAIEVLLPQELRQQHIQYRSAYVQRPAKRAMGADRELLAQHRDGSLVAVEIGLSSYTSDDQLFVLATVVDITKRNELLAASKRLAAIINSTDDAIISKSLDGNITSWNPGAEKLFGYQADEVIGQSMLLLIPEGHEQEEMELLARIARGETIAHYDTVRRHKDGRLIEISNTICPLRDALGRVIGASKIARDISDIKQAERQIRDLNASLQQRVSELDSFAYAVSHDLRAPLRAMSGFSQALLEDYSDRLDAEGQTYLTEIDHASRRMAALIEGILTLSRSTRGEFRKEAMDLSALVSRIRDDLVREEPERPLSWEIEPNARAFGNVRLIENVLRNLIENAWKYTRHTKDASIRFYTEQGDNQRWFCIGDNGAGFDMRHADILYQPFQRLHRQDEFPGLGIGLATVQRIIHRHNGRLRAVSEIGKGATFAFTLPESNGPQIEEPV